MNVIKAKSWDDVPNNFTGKIELVNRNFYWFKDGKRHREDGPAYIGNTGYKVWCLNGFFIWDSTCKLDLTNKIILSKSQHPEYPTVHVWKILNKDGVYERIVILGMEEHITE